ncbi:MAG TPA: hypothetical protein VMU04_03835 [Candidatus Acidoferrum sp.]|nr:hypothetical protein [Candidatus Acidoferrum sp.]
MKIRLLPKKTQPAVEGQTVVRERRINACWLRFWKAVYPNTPPPVESPASKVSSLESAGAPTQHARPKTQDPRPKTQNSGRSRRAAVGYLSRFLCGGIAAVLVAAAGCAGPRPLKGGKATTTRNQAGLVQQTVAQGENASQPSKQDQETIKVRSYTLPAATRIEQSPVPLAAATSVRSQPSTLNPQPSTSDEPSALSPQPSTTYVLAAPMPVIEREETRARTELGAAQKDTARDLAAKLSSLKGIVWVGVGLFIFGLASLVYPPLKAIVASVTTSVALMLGGVALIVLPTMVVGNELLILGGVALVVGAWFLAHRHGQLKGSLESQVQSLMSGAGSQPSAGATAPASAPATAKAQSAAKQARG